ncbi:Imm21 family immunity protein [Micromonospora ureilytica]|uniref:HAD superfamily hydrolase (TIGR01549 family) n=1 Tax=Micromonospora ureilytica TaxID=709868 RepID=A0ABS0JA05_9ACTN|nr:Imm21 family immunity protein [Micromonospora ureilytica]MBG6063789.1 HAD superfamily hydrolase (TIGR01549 family) [Micromonospora ureilytica]WSR56503.1 Imm21 family immunity protein [Micromonospora ureilytica]
MTIEAERPPDRLADIAERAEVVLVDFDGPICRLFGSKAAPRVAADLRQLILSRGVVLPDELRDGIDPLELFRATAVFAPELVGVVGAALEAAEVEAAASAETTIGAFDMVAACLATGRPLAIVSNNSAAAIDAYLGRRDRARYFAAVVGRGEHPDLLKPNPAPVVQALQALKVAPDAAVLVGDSATDVAAARAAGVACVGYANKPGKAERLAAAGADAIVTDMTDLAGVLARTRRPVSQLPWVDSGGGPLIAVPTSALGEWTGASMDDGDSWGDYDRACQVDGYIGVLDVGADQALVLADEPASTTYLPDRRIFVRWIYANSEAEVVRLVPRALKIADWKDAGTWTTSGPAQLFDSGYTGDGLEHTTHLTVDVAAGTYLIRTASVQPDRRTALVLVQLVEQTQPVRVVEQVRTGP